MSMIMHTCVLLAYNIGDVISTTANSLILVVGGGFRTAATAVDCISRPLVDENITSANQHVLSYLIIILVIALVTAMLWLLIYARNSNVGEPEITQLSERSEHKQQQQQQSNSVTTKRSKNKRSKDDSPDTDDSVNSSPQGNNVSKGTANKSKPTSAPPSPEKGRKCTAASAAKTSVSAEQPTSYDSGVSGDLNNDDDDDDNVHQHQSKKRGRRPSSSSSWSSSSSSSSSSSFSKKQEQCLSNGKKTLPSAASNKGSGRPEVKSGKKHKPSKKHAATQNELRQAAAQTTDEDVAEKIATKEKLVKRSTAELNQKKEHSKPRNKENVKPMGDTDRNNNSIIKNNNKSNDDNCNTASKKQGKKSQKKVNKNNPNEFAETPMSKKTRRTTDEASAGPDAQSLTMKPVTTTSSMSLVVPSLSALSPQPSIGKIADVFKDSIRDELDLNDQEIFTMLRDNFVLNEVQMYSHGFPVNSTLYAGSAVYFRPNMRVNMGLNPVAKEFEFTGLPHGKGAGDGRKKQKQQQQQQQHFSSNNHVACVRCTSFYNVKNEDKSAKAGRCVYHSGKLHFSNTHSTAIYKCCSGDRTSRGCTTANQHVWNGFFDGENYADGFVETSSWSSSLEADSQTSAGRVYALDCEMCYTECGLEVTKVTLVDIRGSVVYDTLVQPSRPIIDYNTRYSGINEDDFKNHPFKTLDSVRSDLLRYIRGDTILVGHGLGADLQVLRIIHSMVVDTTVMYLPEGNPLTWYFKRSLKSLASTLLKREIQLDYGHDSKEDARAAMDLALFGLKSSIKNNKF